MADIEPTADPLEHYEYMPCSHALSFQGWICRECAKRWTRNQLQAAEREVAALREEVGRLRSTLKWYADHHESLLSKSASVAIPNYAKQTLEANP